MTEPSAAIPQILSGLAEVIDAYDGLLVDLWGCVHNGIAPFPAAVDALLRAAERGKQVCLLSNGPRRGSVLVRRLDEMGVPRAAYHHVMSSGEAAWMALAERADPFHAALGARCYRMGPERDASVHTDNGLTLVESLAEADFVLCTGIIDNDETVEDYTPALRQALAHNLPMVCANPDLVVHIGDQLTICAGALAQRYQELGGAVSYHGKPYPSVYHQCFRLTGIADRRRLLAMGDGLRTDIKGANLMGIDSLFLTAGIHIDDIGPSQNDPHAVQAVARQIGANPTYVLSQLRW
ncbi:MAG: TIGR01459 family HAD-type hydrolase [Alphaproteobacteria bacterium]|nr:TIGR01459 family HAD-type hydrolase [Alphaproteobacteria bacterium]MCB9928886.1 TIGR01459 family HAD-type hydrolase [Alphaproteobacteria bacterium]